LLFPLLTMSRSCAAFDWATGHEKLTELTGDWPPLECMHAFERGWRWRDGPYVENTAYHSEEVLYRYPYEIAIAWLLETCQERLQLTDTWQ
jgi:hypothetical protein